MTIVDTIFKALAPAIPDRVIAGHHADLVIAKMSGRHPRDGKLFMHPGGLIGGGWGAKQGEDGMSATIAINDGDTHNSPTEQARRSSRCSSRRIALRDDSGGAGKHGAAAWAPSRWCARSARSASTRRSSASTAGPGGSTTGSRRRATRWRCIATARTRTLPVRQGAVASPQARRQVHTASGGGGGFGSPLERDLDAVEHDVRQGYVSLRAARESYGAVDRPRERPGGSGRERAAPRGDARGGLAQGPAVHRRPERSAVSARRGKPCG